MLNQRLQQKLLQKLSPQQIQLMKLIQIPAVALEQRIKQEIEENPALEEMETEGQDEQEQERERDSDDDQSEGDGDQELEERFDDFDIEDYLDDDHIAPYKLVANNRGQDDDDRESPVVSGVSFQEHLLNQVGMYPLDERQKQLMRMIIGNIDDSGYLDRDPAAMVNDFRFSFNITTTKDEIERLLKMIHTFDPPGVGARDLQECLLIQLERSEEGTDSIILARKIMRHYFHEFSKKHYDRILKRANITSDELRGAIDEIMKLNPKPGNAMGDSGRGGVYIIPDFFINNVDGELELRVNNRHMPELRINRTYKQMLEQYASRKGERTSTHDKEALLFVKQKIDSAKWFIDAINQREQTLYITMSAIMAYQSAYFRTGDETNLKPMILKDIAEIVNLDISTISRVANSKYVQTPFGTFLLKSFFSEGLQTESGEEVSSREVKKILEDCITGEDKQKPMTDDHLSEVLKEKGYTLARRTVAKYREQLGIPVARMRKSL